MDVPVQRLFAQLSTIALYHSPALCHSPAVPSHSSPPQCLPELLLGLRCPSRPSRGLTDDRWLLQIKARLNVHSMLEVDPPQVWDTYEPEEEEPAAEAEPEAAAEAEAEPEGEAEAEAEAEPEGEAEGEAEPEAKDSKKEKEPEVKKPKKAKVVKSEISCTADALPGLPADRIVKLIEAEKVRGLTTWDCHPTRWP